MNVNSLAALSLETMLNDLENPARLESCDDIRIQILNAMLGYSLQEMNWRKMVGLTCTFVDGGIDHGAELGEAGLPHDAGRALHGLGLPLLLVGVVGPAFGAGRRARTGGPRLRSPP